MKQYNNDQYWKLALIQIYEQLLLSHSFIMLHFMLDSV